MVQKNAQKEYEKLSAQVNDLQNQVNDNQINIPSDTQTETENVAQEVQTEDSELEQKGIEIPQKNLNWKKLKGVNQDIYAWIYIPGTGVDYPVLQHPSDDSYYLNYNMNGTRGYPGCIYTEKANSKEFTDFDTVVYGHNMRNDTMFASLHNYEDQTFFNNFPYIYVYTKEKVHNFNVPLSTSSWTKHASPDIPKSCRRQLSTLLPVTAQDNFPTKKDRCITAK